MWERYQIDTKKIFLSQYRLFVWTQIVEIVSQKERVVFERKISSKHKKSK